MQPRPQVEQKMMSTAKIERLEEIPCVVLAPVSVLVNTHGTDIGKRSSTNEREAAGTASTTASDHHYCVPNRSGCQVMDIELNQPSCISIIRFRNNYTYSIAVLYQSSVVSYIESTKDLGHSNVTTEVSNKHEQSHSRGCEKWEVGVAKHLLMPSCHCDSPEAQEWVELGQTAFQNRLEDVVRLRLILKQPSPHWRHFGVLNFSCYHVYS